MEAPQHLMDFLVDEGTAEVEHDSKIEFLSHLKGVYDELRRWRCSEPVCLGGLFHSIYGAEGFDDAALPLDRRTEIRGLIGTAAERLAFVNSAMRYASFDETLAEGSPHSVVNRFSGERIALSEAEFTDLCRIQLADWLEQVERSPEGWSYRRGAYRSMAELLGGPALEAYDSTFAREL